MSAIKLQLRSETVAVCRRINMVLDSPDLRLLFLLGEKYYACSSELSDLQYSPVISSLLAPNIFLSTLFPNIIKLGAKGDWDFRISDLVKSPDETDI